MSRIKNIIIISELREEASEINTVRLFSKKPGESGYKIRRQFISKVKYVLVLRRFKKDAF